MSSPAATQKYDIHNRQTGKVTYGLTAAQIEHRYAIPAEDLEWSIEEEGVCTWISSRGHEMAAVHAGDEAIWG